MDEKEFIAKVEEVDKRLREKNVPIHARPFHAFPLMAPHYNGPVIGYGVDPNQFPEFEGPNLLNRINDWYKQQYGDRVYMPTVLGKAPILLKGEIYLIRIPLAYGKPTIGVLPLVDGITPHMARSLTNMELDEIRSAFVNGYNLIYEFEDLFAELEAKKVPVAQNPFLIRAIQDRDTAIDCMTGQLDLNGACFHAQQHGEKMLKAVLLDKGSMSENEIGKKFGHKLRELRKTCLKLEPSVSDVYHDIEYLVQFKMNIRYSSKQIDIESAVQAYWSALRIGGLCATILSEHERRYQ